MPRPCWEALEEVRRDAFRPVLLVLYPLDPPNPSFDCQLLLKFPQGQSFSPSSTPEAKRVVGSSRNEAVHEIERGSEDEQRSEEICN